MKASRGLAIRAKLKTFQTADVAVVHASVSGRGRVQDYGREVALVIGIAQSSQERDLVDKVTDYAATGIMDYLVVDVEARVTHAFHLPEGTYVATGKSVPFGQDLAVRGTNPTITIPDELD